ncbi:dihydropyrimidinase [Clostridium botulinum]|uniref:Dihydropyrimidinase n=1 Tax=Clostridium botulinum TaxID=1491 RepID=A0A6B4JP25_CLOBO|nr:dihydropyrimidinase [Clostridium botulinum]EES50216.1 dihydropyrimidinase [Clostridium botulinum E1 str. 'BoNT E Beluga']MBY6762154.1 dihydropyrimidinase [Clostridium botulinum]MBY6920533.1 dihydropyrimidinase [Clostridium botulinum]MCR1131751.1 dihydropyrimidinase [Clostridium botulinum]NFJ58375.1 dihydropyrimidinase [Clostridium botulinum]
MSLLIKNGTVITASDIYNGDIYIKDGIIREIGTNLIREADEIVDAEGKYVIPGGVDAHTHLNLDVGVSVANDDFYTGTVAAACGGTTTVVDHMGFGPKGCNLKYQVDVYHGYADDKAVIDYSFHGVVQHVNDSIIDEMKKIVDEEGIPSFKVYLTYDYMIDDKGVLKILNRLKELQGIMTVHCENDGSIKLLKENYIRKGLISPLYHCLSRPVETEAEAVNRMINMESIVKDAPLYIVHLSSELGLDYVKMARERGQRIYSETCPQYLVLDESKYNLPNNESLKYVISPPLRSKRDIEKLWKGINDGYIQTIASDHCPFSFKEDKQKGKDDFTKCPNGAPGIEERIPLIFSEGVMNGRISINKFVDLCCTKPAKIFGLYPKKGTIQVGSDGDIVIIDPQKEVIMSNSNLHSNVDYSAYEGIKVKGYPIMTISRGKIIVRDNKFIGKKGYGKFIKRSKVNLKSI